MKMIILLLSLLMFPFTEVSAQTQPSDLFMSIAENNTKVTSGVVNYSCEVNISGRETEAQGTYEFSLDPYKYHIVQRVEEGTDLISIDHNEENSPNQAKIKGLIEKRDKNFDQLIADHGAEYVEKLFDNYFNVEYDDGEVELKLKPTINKSAFWVDFAGIFDRELFEILVADQLSALTGEGLTSEQISKIAQSAINNTQSLEIQYNSSTHVVQGLDWEISIPVDENISEAINLEIDLDFISWN